MNPNICTLAAALLLTGCPFFEGGDDTGATPPGQDLRFVEVGVGWSFSCARADDGVMRCWGSAVFGEEPPRDAIAEGMDVGYDGVCWLTPGTGAIACAGLEVEPPIPEGAFLDVAIGRSAACAIDEAGELTCFELPIGDETPDPAPLGELPAGPFDAASLGAGQGVALRPDGTLATFGPYSTEPPAGTFVQVSAGYREVCALADDGSLACWSSDTAYDYVLDTPTGDDFVQVAAGYRHSCALDGAGAVTCWGDNTMGQTDAPATGTYVDVAAGGEYSCAVTDSGDLVCWGNDAYQGTPPR